MSVRVRFAPSPTGFLHVGGLRTALYNYMFASRYGGKFILRIEDTDRTRLVDGAIENLLESLKWAGIEFDESPQNGGDYGSYIQSERLEIYTRYAKELIESGAAYYAFDTSEEIENMRQKLKDAGSDFKYNRKLMRNQFTLEQSEIDNLLKSGSPKVIRLLVDNSKSVIFNDIIRGEVTVKGDEIDDQILLKSDGFPTYHLANVVDDHLMKISHVIRGEEWLPSTPKHILLYEAFSWDKPQFAHLPLLLNPDKSKLSKRTGSVSVEEFRKSGYIKEAFINFIALLGWNPTADREIFEIQELIDVFDLSKINKSGAVFDRNKLAWLNAQYLRKTPLDTLSGQLLDILKDKGYVDFPIEYISRVLSLFIERIEFLHEILEKADYMFAPPQTYDNEFKQKVWKNETWTLMEPLLEIIKKEDLNPQQAFLRTKEYSISLGLKVNDLILPLRLMITGKSAGAGLFETMEVLGKEECFKRIESFLEMNEILTK